MKTNNKPSLKVFILMLLTILLGSAKINMPQHYSLGGKSNSLIIKGTSSMHDWEMKAQGISCDFTFANSPEVKSIDKVSFSCKSSQLTSDNSVMTKKAQEALKTQKYPEIKFIMTSLNEFKSKGEVLSGNITGDLLIAGVKNKVSVAFTGNFIGNNGISIKGSKKIKMSDYKIEPPTAMLGALKTGDEVTIVFELNFVQR